MSKRYAVVCPECAVTVGYEDDAAQAEELRQGAAHGDIDPELEPYVLDTFGVGEPNGTSTGQVAPGASL